MRHSFSQIEADGLTEQQRGIIMDAVRQTVAGNIERGHVPGAPVHPARGSAPGGSRG
jgi:hypothetical protein